jgi:hypothetical protein
MKTKRIVIYGLVAQLGRASDNQSVFWLDEALNPMVAGSIPVEPAILLYNSISKRVFKKDYI